jgi:outer membrane receptor protein involved in Fe transport
MRTHKQYREESEAPAKTALASTISALVAGGAMQSGAAQESAQAQAAVEEITVTGSRIVRRDLESSSPLITVSTEQLENTSNIGVEATLNTMPQFVAGDTQYDTSNTEPSAFVTPGIASLNLRGLGVNRNLVLIDGRRAQPANALLIVDINTIPAAAIERVETITGGASAVYGADALAGVVNFVLKDDFEGVSLDFQSSETMEGEGAESKFSALIGMNAADGRGNVMFGVDWTKRSLVMQKDRDWRAAGWFDDGSISGGFLQSPGYRAGANVDARFPTVQLNPPSQTVVDDVFSQYDPNYDRTSTTLCTGASPISSCRRVSNTAEMFWNADGSPFLQNGYNYRGPYGSTDINGQGFTGVKLRPDGFLEQATFEGLISTPLDRRSAFGRATYDINDNLQAFAQANYTSAETRQVAGYIPAITVWQAVIPNDARTMPADLKRLLNSRSVRLNSSGAPIANTGPTAPWVLYRGLDYLGPERSTNQTDLYQTMFGVEGSFPRNDWTWEAYVSTGRTTNLYLGFQGSQQRYQSLVSAGNWGQSGFVFGAGYQQTCTTGLPTFGGAWPSDNCIESVQSKNKWLTQITQDIAEFNLQGKIVDMRAGELRFAVGASARRNSFLFEPSEINDDVSVIEQLQGIFVANNASGTTEVKEVYGELLVPLTERLDLEFGYRLSEYDTSGNADTWKALFTYAATDNVRLRGGFQFATRAPNVAELYSGPAVSTVSFPFSDPCSFTTLAPWGNIAANPNRLQVQQLCVDIIGSETSDFGAAGSTAANTFARPGSPFFPLENENIKGNPNLRPEEADTWTLGVVLSGPGGLENLQASFDIYNVEIAEAIAPLDSTFVYGQCFNSTGASNPTYSLDDPGGYCRMITRNPVNGGRSRVEAPFFNTGVLQTTGLDIGINWSADFGPGSFNVGSVATIIDRFETQDNPSEPIFDAVGTLDQGGQFDYRFVTTLNYAFGDSQVGLQWRHYPSIKDDDAARDPNTRILPVESYNVFNLLARYSINEKMEFRGGIDNLLDEEPPVVGADPGSVALGLPSDNNLGDTNSGFYDVLGRRVYVGLQMNF